MAALPWERPHGCSAREQGRRLWSTRATEAHDASGQRGTERADLAAVRGARAATFGTELRARVAAGSVLHTVPAPQCFLRYLAATAAGGAPVTARAWGPSLSPISSQPKPGQRESRPQWLVARESLAVDAKYWGSHRLKNANRLPIARQHRRLRSPATPWRTSPGRPDVLKASGVAEASACNLRHRPAARRHHPAAPEVVARLAFPALQRWPLASRRASLPVAMASRGTSSLLGLPC